MLFFVLLGFERSHIDREAVLHIGLEQSLVGLVDLLDGDDFDIGGDVMCPAKVEHLLGLGDTADVRAGEAAAAHDEAEGRDAQGLRGSADKGKVAVEAEQVEIGVDVVLGGDGVEDEVEAAGVLFISPALRETTTSSAPRRSASSFLLGEVVKTTTWAPNA
jgi:hypothetical protein